MDRMQLEQFLTEVEDLNKKDIYVWGTGNTAQLYQEGLGRIDIERIFAYVDNDEQKWGGEFCGVKIVSPNELAMKKNQLVLICTPQPAIYQSIAKQLKMMNITYRHIDDYILKSHKNEILECFDLLTDEDSKRIYSEIIKCRISCMYPDDTLIETDTQYFSFKGFNIPGEVMIDCGAYVGDSFETYLWKTEGAFKKVLLFEPDKKNINAMQYRIDRLKNEWGIDSSKIEIYNYAIGDKSSTKYFSRYDNNNGFGSKITNEGHNAIKVVALDDIIKEKCNIIKADIESYEYKLIVGAEKTIKKFKPKLAICIYHNAVDLYSIMLLIHSFLPEYHFSIRHYTSVLSDTVLYAYLA